MDAKKVIEEKADDIASGIEAELSAGMPRAVRSAIDMIFRSWDRKAKITATVDLEYSSYDEKLRVAVALKTEGKLQSKGEPIGWEVNLDGQQELPLDAPPEGDGYMDAEVSPPALPGSPKLLPAPEGGAEEGEVVEVAPTDGDGGADPEATVADEEPVEPSGEEG